LSRPLHLHTHRSGQLPSITVRPQGLSKPTSPKPQSPAPEPPRAEQPSYAPYKRGTVAASSIQRRNSFSGEQAPVDAAAAQYRPFHEDAKVTSLDKTLTAQHSEFGPIRRAGTTVDMNLSPRPSPIVQRFPVSLPDGLVVLLRESCLVCIPQRIVQRFPDSLPDGLFLSHGKSYNACPAAYPTVGGIARRIVRCVLPHGLLVSLGNSFDDCPAVYPTVGSCRSANCSRLARRLAQRTRQFARWYHSANRSMRT
jgi:hypothetical protein